jgi:hypothetical protein
MNATDDFSAIFVEKSGFVDGVAVDAVFDGDAIVLVSCSRPLLPSFVAHFVFS